METITMGRWSGLFIALGFASLSCSNSLLASDVGTFSVVKAQSFVQTNSGAAVLAGSSGFMFQAELDANGNNSVSSVNLKIPGNSSVALSAKDNGFRTKQFFDSGAALDAAFPDGLYTYLIQAVNDGSRTNILNLSGGLYPPTPHITNFVATQAIDPANNFILGWDAISGGTSNDLVQISIRDCQGQEFFNTPDVGQPGALNGLSTGAMIPSGTLRPGATYSLQLVVARTSTYDTNSYPGAVGMAGYFKSVQINLVTIGVQTGCPVGSFQLIFNFAQGSFGSGTTGLISFPQSLQYYFALFNIDNDTNYPDTVTFTGPSGSGLNNTTNQNNGSTFGTSAFYSSPALNTPPFPPGGIYTVNYKGISNNFNLPNPNASNQQVLIVPSVAVNSSNLVTQINWTYKDSSGATISPKAFMNKIAIRVQGLNGMIFDTENDNNSIPASVTNYVVNQAVSWTNVTSIGMVFNDSQGNQYNSYWNRASQPVVITTPTNLPPATQASPYSFLLSATGGSQQFSWSAVSNSMPAGLALNPITGEISGLPSQSGTFNFLVTVTDTYSQSTNRNFSLLINPAPVPRPALSSPVKLSNGQFKFHVNGTSGQNYTLQSSSNLVTWVSLFTISAPASSFDVTDPNASGAARRFYRLLVGP